MKQNIFSPMEIDAIGEIMNISLGSSATAVSNMLDHRVDITTPSVSVVPIEEFTLGELEPAIGIEIKYVSGLEGSNIMLLKRHDVKTIVEILMGTEISDEEFEFNDLTISAVCEVMNQMMGAASTALSDFLGRSVNISTPQSFTLDDLDQFEREHFQYDSGMVVVAKFMLSIENVLKSEFVNVMSVDLARELIAGFGVDLSDGEGKGAKSEEEVKPEPSTGGAKLSQEEIERLMSGGAPSAPPPASSGSGKLSQEEIERLMSGGAPSAPPPASSGSGKLSQEEIEQLMSGMAPSAAQAAPPRQPEPQQSSARPYEAAGQYMPAPPAYAGEPRVINTKPVQLPPLDVADKIGQEQAQNLELIMSVPLEVSVEIGRTRRKVEDILTFSKGSLVVLDKLAGDQVDLFVNGLCVARGDVVVIDDNFGIRITEVLKRPELSELTRAD
ncbi:MULTISPECIES: flagellar motor switch protein FliN [Eubacteriales]|uniref:flagellar motor switch protein FliN n=2 Tax=Clostridia TaxID=186801 RepID=UPI00067EC046|nr:MULTISPECIES: flagellar motor switch protein FliN [Eubacteriales]MCB5925285.1 flagellar motor switch protein FliN [bacterium 210820-DFI.5.26]MCQ5159009.1 flagellar motor switch protein FliN [Clostridium sp. DFI.5.61]UMM47555.1 flagellar motor switch protein FliN [Lawsonibacter asaccharolyticus]